MGDSTYPSQIDNDQNLPRVDDNISEIGGEAINSVRSAVFAIEEALGIEPQGTATDLATRLDASLNSDGTLKASALSTVGLVTLPITNSQVATNAGIVESKLDLNYNTTYLKTRIEEVNTFALSINEALLSDIANLNQHVGHPGVFGRHQTSDIDGYISPYASLNLQGIVNDLYTRITNHIGDLIDAHDASAISVVQANLQSISADDVQEAIEALDLAQLVEVIKHRDQNHSNGINNDSNVNLIGENHSTTSVSSAALNSFNSGTRTIQFSSVPAGISSVKRYDRIDVTVGGNTYRRNIKSVNTATAAIEVFRELPVGGAGTAVIYQSSEETSADSQLKLALRQPNVSSTGGSVIQLIHPSSPYILSSGCDPRLLSSAASDIKIRWATGETADIDVNTAIQTYPVASSLQSTWTVENLVIALNETFRSETLGYHYPLIAFVHNGEIGIAFDEADGYIEAVAPTSNSAWSALGFSGTEKVDALENRNFYIDGYEFSGIRKIIDANGETTGSSNVSSIDVDLVSAGIVASGLVRVSNSVADDGTYVYDAITTSTLTINEHPIFTSDSSVDIKIYSDYFSVPTTPVNRTLFELFIDGYELGEAELRGIPRAEYINAGGTPDNPEIFFDIISVSRNFSASEKRIRFEDNSGVKTAQLGSRGSGLLLSTSGETVTLPTTTAEGYKFKLYDLNGIDYVELMVADSSYATVTNDNAIDVEIYDRISEDKFLLLGTVLHDKTSFKHLFDRRLLGSVGRKDVRTDYTRDYVSYPRSLMRGNGVIYGCVVENPTGDLYISGGQVVVDGQIFNIERTVFFVPEDALVSTYNVFIDSDGTPRLLQDDQHVSGQLTTPSVAEIIASNDKTIIAQVEVNAGNSVTAINDFRRFVNNLDNKVDLFVEENSITHGSFASIDAALNYADIAVGDNQPLSRVLRIKGDISITSNVILSSNLTIEGDCGGSQTTQTGSRLSFNGSGYLTLGNNNTLRNLNLYSETTNFSGLVRATGKDDILIENCSFQYSTYDPSNTGISLLTSGTNINVNKCSFANTGSSISCVGANQVIFKNNVFDDIALAVLSVDSYDMIISNNVVDTSNVYSVSPYLIKLQNCGRINISDNILSTDATSAETGAMIRLQTTSNRVNIENNILMNTDVNSQGFSKGIWMEGSVIGDHFFNIVSNNQLHFFFGTAPSIAIDIDAGDNISVLNNKVFNAARALDMFDCQFSTVSGNTLNTWFSSETTVKIDATTPLLSGAFNNLINNQIASSNVAPNAELVEITDIGFGNTISGNLFCHLFAVISSAALLSCAADVTQITNNIFNGGIYSTASPLVYSGSNGMVAYNNLNQITAVPAAGHTDVDGYSADTMNLGTEYNTFIPLNRAKRNHAASDWEFTVGVVTNKVFLIATTASGTPNNHLLIEFTQADLMPSKTNNSIELVKVEVRCAATLSAGLDLELVKSEFSFAGSGGSTIVSANPVGVGDPETVTLIPASRKFLGPDESFAVRAISQVAAVNNIYGVMVYWKLN